MVVQAFNPSSQDAVAGACELDASLENQEYSEKPCLGYTEKPCFEKEKKKKRSIHQQSLALNFLFVGMFYYTRNKKKKTGQWGVWEKVSGGEFSYV